ncbi:hypothetical protein [Providencia sneebia]|uniref:Rhs family protein n=1 Tax=Providencia sneebia DSM 19967 TaxID=1141660 RepID=K8W7W2_9GAMM|nr:hypothetical protein [Providencia sneebia]EKT53557.1 Rhs family protein [Providencia sneebia DSM 19967]
METITKVRRLFHKDRLSQREIANKLQLDNHRMVTAKEIYMKTGDSQYINKLIENGRWTIVESTPTGARPLPSRN